MLRNVGDAIPFDSIEAVTGAAELSDLQKLVQRVEVSDPVLAYLVALVDATRSHPLIRTGGSPRASRALYKAAKALAAMDRRSFVTPDDVQQLAGPVLCHRLVLTSEARMAGKTAAALVDELIAALPVPPDRTQIFPHEA